MYRELLLRTISCAGNTENLTFETHTIQPGETKSFVKSYRAVQIAAVAVSGDGDTDLDMFVYDEQGNLITHDTEPIDECICVWKPTDNGRYVIKVVNRGAIYNEFGIAMN
ncbi:MAG: hypothetical protein KIT45_05180 [Fimbriimonadia bacterium]|nr:hypothetical protein [Fimbriimonadia bacterium]